MRAKILTLFAVSLISGCGELQAIIDDLVEDFGRSIESQLDLTPDEINFDLAGADAVAISEKLQTVEDIDRFILGEKRWTKLQTSQAGAATGTTPGAEEAVTGSTTTSEPTKITAATNVMRIDTDGTVKPAANAIADFLHIGKVGTLAVVQLTCPIGRPGVVDPEADEATAALETAKLVDYCSENVCPCFSGEYTSDEANQYQVGYFIPHDGSDGTRFDFGGVAGFYFASEAAGGEENPFIGENRAGDLVFRSGKIFRAGTFKIDQINTTIDNPAFSRISGNFVVVISGEEGELAGSSFVLDTSTGEKTFDAGLHVALSDDTFLSSINHESDNFGRYNFDGSGDGNRGQLTRSTVAQETYMSYMTGGGEPNGPYDNRVTLAVDVNISFMLQSQEDSVFVPVTNGAIGVSNFCAPDSEIYSAAINSNSVGDPLLDNGEIPGSCDPATDTMCTAVVSVDQQANLNDYICLLRPDGTTKRLVDAQLTQDEVLSVSGDYLVVKDQKSLRFAVQGATSFTTIFDSNLTITQFSIAGSKVFYVGEPNIGDAISGVYDMATGLEAEIDTSIALKEVFGINR